MSPSAIRHRSPATTRTCRSASSTVLSRSAVAFSALTALVLAGCGDAGGADAAADDPIGKAASVARDGQGQPFVDGPELWMASLASPEEPMSALPQLGVGRNITERAGYDNQPKFAPDGTVLYTLGVGDRTDIWRYDPESDTHAPVTRTEGESEYSATPIPGEDAISVIRVEADSAQRLWRIEVGGDGAGDGAGDGMATGDEVILPDIAPVGYHAWANDSTLALFVLGNPATLQRATPGPGEGEVLVEGIGRSLNSIPGSERVSYPATGGEGPAEIRSWDPESGAHEALIASLEGSQDHAWTPGGVLLQGSGAVLYGLRPGVDESWQPVGELPDSTMRISRLAVSEDGSRIVLVVERDGGSR